MQTEEWKDIEGYEGYYSISNTGKVYSYHRGKQISQHFINSGYLFVKLSLNGDSKQELVHRLVAQYFLERCSGCDIVNHKDGDRTNNLSTNLEWTTQYNNIQHSINIGLKKSGWCNDKAKHYYIETPEGQCFYIRNLRLFCRNNGLEQAAMQRVSVGEQSNHKGYKAKLLEFDTEY